jgi:hypothetical protein
MRRTWVFLTVLSMLAMSGEVRAQTSSVSGPLVVLDATGSSSCPDETIFFEGQSVRLDGSGFDSGATVTIWFGKSYDSLTVLSTTSADASGAIDHVVALVEPPPGLQPPVLAVMRAVGPTGAGAETLYLTRHLPIADGPGSDTDLDGIPDICDNCPGLPNAGQEDDDGDGLGNPCDSCPNDAENDSDGDGLCGDVDSCPYDALNDSDLDGHCADEDNCPATANPTQADSDGNGIGDACQTAPTCSDGIDNDGDGVADYPDDKGCSDALDTTETDVAIPCDDGIDNDFDGLTDYSRGLLSDPGCAPVGVVGAPEDPQCDDGLDNDGDGGIDWDGDYGLHSPDPECGGVGATASE